MQPGFKALRIDLLDVFAPLQQFERIKNDVIEKDGQFTDCKDRPNGEEYLVVIDSSTPNPFIFVHLPNNCNVRYVESLFREVSDQTLRIKRVPNKAKIEAKRQQRRAPSTNSSIIKQTPTPTSPKFWKGWTQSENFNNSKVRVLNPLPNDSLPAILNYTGSDNFVGKIRSLLDGGNVRRRVAVHLHRVNELCREMGSEDQLKFEPLHVSLRIYFDIVGLWLCRKGDADKLVIPCPQEQKPFVATWEQAGLSLSNVVTLEDAFNYFINLLLHTGPLEMNSEQVKGFIAAMPETPLLEIDRHGLENLLNRFSGVNNNGEKVMFHSGKLYLDREHPVPMKESEKCRFNECTGVQENVVDSYDVQKKLYGQPSVSNCHRPGISTGKLPSMDPAGPETTTTRSILKTDNSARKLESSNQGSRSRGVRFSSSPSSVIDVDSAMGDVEPPCAPDNDDPVECSYPKSIDGKSFLFEEVLVESQPVVGLPNGVGNLMIRGRGRGRWKSTVSKPETILPLVAIEWPVDLSNSAIPELPSPAMTSASTDTDNTSLVSSVDDKYSIIGYGDDSSNTTELNDQFDESFSDVGIDQRSSGASSIPISSSYTEEQPTTTQEERFDPLPSVDTPAQPTTPLVAPMMYVPMMMMQPYSFPVCSPAIPVNASDTMQGLVPPGNSGPTPLTQFNCPGFMVTITPIMPPQQAYQTFTPTVPSGVGAVIRSPSPIRSNDGGMRPSGGRGRGGPSSTPNPLSVGSCAFRNPTPRL